MDVYKIQVSSGKLSLVRVKEYKKGLEQEFFWIMVALLIAPARHWESFGSLTSGRALRCLCETWDEKPGVWVWSRCDFSS